MSNNSSENISSIASSDLDTTPQQIHSNVEKVPSSEKENQEGIDNVIKSLERTTSIGPLLQAYDLQKTFSHAKPNTTYNEADEWKYPIDEATSLRLVEFVPGDKGDPRNFSKGFKWYLTIFLGILCFTVSMCSAMVTADIKGPMKTFGVSEEVVILTVSLMVLGFGFGPLAFSPVSEEVGRNIIYISTLFIAVVFIIPCALAKNIGTLLVCRLIDGLAFSAPMTLIGGSLSDMWVAQERGMAMAIFSAAPYMGPVVAPIAGGFIGDNVGWRWIYWVLLIWSGFIYIIMVITVPETHHGTILKRRAKKLRKLTGDNKYQSITELKKRPPKVVLKETLARPFLLLSESIVFLVTLYMANNYGLLYMFFFAYPIVYGEGKGWDDWQVGLMFIPIAVGLVLATALAPMINKDYIRRAAKYEERGELPPPEIRLIPMMWGAFAIPIGLFCFAWTSYPRLHWAGPSISGFACGFGFLMVYNPANNYIVDSYQHYAASALASKTFIRSVWGAGVCLFTVQMYHRLGYEWATSLMAFISLVCCCIPFLFYKYGAHIRERSKYAYSPSAEERALFFKKRTLVTLDEKDIENDMQAHQKDSSSNTTQDTDTH